MNNRKLLATVGAVTFIAIFLASFPARIAAEWFAPDNIRLSGISGTVWSGQAAEIAFADEYVSNLRWTLKPLYLLTARFAATAEVTTLAGRLETSVIVSPGGTLHLSDLRGALRVADLHPTFSASGIDGELHLALAELVVEDGFPTAATGTLAVESLAARAMGARPLGRFSADIYSDDSGIHAAVTADESLFELTGALTLSADRGYLFTGDIAETSQTPDNVRQNLRFLGSPDANGNRQFRFEGSL